MKLSFTLFLLLFSYLSHSQGKSDIEYQNKVYDINIKTVQLYPNTSQPSSQTFSPVLSLRSNLRLRLEFDELFNEAYTYRAKLVHCNADWQPSGLSPLQYLNDYNEFDILDFEYSFGTRTPYVHYTFLVPKPTISGNYLLVVYGEDEEDVIITRRFMVYEQRVTFTPAYEIVNNSPYSLNKQHLQFEVRYESIDLINPMEYVAVNILQNQRWDNAKMNVKPSFAREAQRILEYRRYTDESAFDAGNEFRYFDIRSLQYFGFHVRTVHFKKDKIYTYVESDKPRAPLAYSIEQNINGQFYIENVERKIPEIENDYSLVTFTLQSKKMDEDVYISGQFTGWQKNANTLMKYNSKANSYVGTYLLKQGLYDYQYILGAGKRENEIEGNKRETNNFYEILVYYRSQELAADLLIGYTAFVFGANR
jgi:Type 9 secretion system plug protein 1st domain